MTRRDCWGKPFWKKQKMEKSKRLLHFFRVTVVTVTLSHPQTPPLKLLMKIRDMGDIPISLILTKAQSKN